MSLPSPRGGYSTREVAALLGFSQAQVRACVRAGFVEPEAAANGDFIFSFQDVVLLRAAKSLLTARIPRRRIGAALHNLHTQLPQGRSLSGVRISAQGSSVVARDGGDAWHPESGQTLLDFDIDDLAQAALPAHSPAAVSRFAAALAAGPRAVPKYPEAATEWYDRGVELESDDPAAAIGAYRQALSLDPELADAHLNLGRLLHETGDAPGAEAHYRHALAARPDALAAYNLGVALQDQSRLDDAATAYRQALDLDPNLADAHFNLSGIYESLGDKPAAFRHLRTYRTLLTRGSAT